MSPILIRRPFSLATQPCTRVYRRSSPYTRFIAHAVALSDPRCILAIIPVGSFTSSPVSSPSRALCIQLDRVDHGHSNSTSFTPPRCHWTSLNAHADPLCCARSSMILPVHERPQSPRPTTASRVHRCIPSPFDVFLVIMVLLRLITTYIL